MNDALHIKTAAKGDGLGLSSVESINLGSCNVAVMGGGEHDLGRALNMG